MNKPFYRFPIYWIKRAKFNPMKLIFGEYYLSSDCGKWFSQHKFDLSEIKFVPIEK